MDTEPKDSWAAYGKLVLNELKRLNEGQDHLRKDMDDRFKELDNTLSKFHVAKRDVEDLKAWKEKVDEVWSSSQMKEAVDEVYAQKAKWQKTAGIIVAINVIFGLVLTLLMK